MRSAVSIGLSLLLALSAPAQFKKFTSLSELQGHFDQAAQEATKKIDAERLAALEAYLADKANADKPDVVAGRMDAARANFENDKFDAAKKHAEAVVKDGKDPAMAAEAGLILYQVNSRTAATTDALKELHSKFIAGLPDDAINQAFEATSGASGRLNVGFDDFDGAKAVWKALDEKFGDNAQFGAQIKQVVQRQMSEIDGATALIGTDPKPFSVKDMKGNELSIEKNKGKVTLLDFWATWCGPCVGELPNVIAAYKKFHPKGFEIIGISLDRDKKAVLDKFLAARPAMTWPQFYDGKFWENELAQLYGVKGIPATYLLDQNGKIFRTGLRGDALAVGIERLLTKGPPAAKPESRKN
jgi:thiol-disulfide isomerase/thioredoxin